jgi:uncharacterized protein with FMN-binding domain
VRTRAKVASILSSGAVLLLGWQLGQHAAAADVAAPATTSESTTSGTTSSGSTGTTGTTDTGTSGTTGTTGTDTGTGTGTGTGTTDSGTSTTTSGVADGTYTGGSVQTRFGSVQVSVTISGGAITDVTALHLTDAEQRSAQISNQAAPILREEVLSAQSASVSIVSRATYTSDAYLQSVQSALDAAGW